ELGREIVDRRIVLKRGDEFALFVAEPAVEKILEPLPLQFDFGTVRRVERYRGRIRITEHVDVGQLVDLAPLDRGQDLISGAARIRLARRQPRKAVRQRRAEPSAEDRQYQIAIGRFGDLFLERVM